MPINANTSKLGLTTAEESKKEVINLKEVALYGSFLFYQRVLHEGIENEVEPRMTCRFSLNRFTDHSFWSTHINLLICVWQVDLGSVSFSIPLCQIPDTHTHSQTRFLETDSKFGILLSRPDFLDKLKNQSKQNKRLRE